MIKFSKKIGMFFKPYCTERKFDLEVISKRRGVNLFLLNVFFPFAVRGIQLRLQATTRPPPPFLSNFQFHDATIFTRRSDFSPNFTGLALGVV